MRRGAVSVSATWHLFGCSLSGMSAVGVALIGVSAQAGQGSGAGQSVSWVAVAYSGLGVLGVLGRGGWCIGVSVYCRTPAPIAPRASLDRCIGVLPQSRAVRSQCPLNRCIGVSVYCRSPAPIARRAPLDRCIGVSVYYRSPAPIAPRAFLDRCIGVLPQSRAVRSQCPLDRCIGVSVYYRSPAPIAAGAPLDRCIGVSVYYRNPAPIAPSPRTRLDRCIGVSRQSCADRSRGPPGSVYRCIGAWEGGIGVSVYRCISIFLPPPAVALQCHSTYYNVIKHNIMHYNII